MTNVSQLVYDLDWSPSGDRIAFELNEPIGNVGIHLVDPDGTNQTKIIERGRNPRWSPDGQHILFGCEGFHCLAVWALDGSISQDISQGRVDNTSLVYSHPWSPDSSRVVFQDTLAGHNCPCNLWKVNINGPGLTQLTSSGGDNGSQWSPILDPLPPPPQRKILFIQGIHSNGSCGDLGDDLGFKDRVGWMREFISSDPSIKSRYPSIHYGYFDYSAASACPPFADYQSTDTCGRAAGFNDYRDRLKAQIDQLTQDGSQVTVIGHSMGGLIAAYLVASDPTWAKQHVASVATFDSMPEGVPYQNLAVMANSPWGATPCRYAALWECPYPFDFVLLCPHAGQIDPSILAMLRGSPEVATARNACTHVPFFTIDAIPTSVAEAVPASSAHFSLHNPGCDNELSSYESPAVAPFEHSRVWENASDVKKNFLRCAILASRTCNSQVVIVPQLATASRGIDIPEAQASARIRKNCGCSVVTTALRDPFGNPPPEGTIHRVGADFEEFELINPLPGTWTVELFGSDVPPGGEPTVLTLETTPAPLADDPDEDGVLSGSDNCAALYNPFQANADSDGFGDACDDDDDDDAVSDVEDNCPFVANLDQANVDADGTGDACDGDDDNDGITDATEASHSCLIVGQSDGALDQDSDFLPSLMEILVDTDPCAADSDRDGFADGAEVLTIGSGPADPCGNDGWPANLIDPPPSDPPPSGVNTLNIGDFNSFLFPLRGDGSFNKFSHPVPDTDDPSIARWNLIGGNNINIGDLNALNPGVNSSTARPPMFGGQPAFFTDLDGPSGPLKMGECPYTP